MNAVLNRLAALLERSGDYRVLCRLLPKEQFRKGTRHPGKTRCPENFIREPPDTQNLHWKKVTQAATQSVTQSWMGNWQNIAISNS